MPHNRQNRGSTLTRFIKGLYLTDRFFKVLGIVVLGFIISFLIHWLFYAMIVLLGVLVVILLVDSIALYRQQNGVEAYRICPDRMSNGDCNHLAISVTNNYPFKIGIKIVEEAPFQFQKRDLIFEAILVPEQVELLRYELYPSHRGVYVFGNVNIFVTGVFHLLSRRYIFQQQKQVPVYPSFLEMRKYELLASSNRLTDYGVKRIRRIGHASEFDQIKHYVLGDDPRTINYKATARMNQLMVNSYEEEKSQPVYCIIDKGRTMRMPFNGMTLLDYAINSALMVCSTSLSRGDKAGIITFSKAVDDILVADGRLAQRNIILELLYSQRTAYLESDYAQLATIVRRKITQRSLIVLYTNFETLNGMRRQINYLRMMAKDHLVLVALFLNSEFNEVLDDDVNDVESLFRKGIAEKLSYDKELIVKELNRYGIHTILSTPEKLTINSINKYIEFKARGLV